MTSFTRSLMLSAVYSFNEREAASTASAIIRMAPIFIRVFMDSRTAFITHVTMVLICAAAVKYQYEFIIIQIVSGLVAIYSLRELTRRAQVFKTAILVTLASMLVYFTLQLMNNNGIDKMDYDMYYHFTANGIAEYKSGFYAFMDASSMRALFDRKAGYYNVLMSQEPLDLETPRIYSMTTYDDVMSATR